MENMLEVMDLHAGYMSTELMCRVYRADVEMADVPIRGKSLRVCVPVMR